MDCLHCWPSIRFVVRTAFAGITVLPGVSCRQPLASSHPQTVLQATYRRRIADVDFVVLHWTNLDMEVRTAEHLSEREALMRVRRAETDQLCFRNLLQQAFQPRLNIDPCRNRELASGCRDVESRNAEMLQQFFGKLRPAKAMIADGARESYASLITVSSALCLLSLS
jgi:hypothetical protein